MAVAMVLIWLGHRQAACLTLMGVSTYLRPSSLFSLLRGSLIPPTRGATEAWSVLAHSAEEGSASKVGERDESLLLDSEWLNWMGPAWTALSAGPKDARLWDLDYPSYLAVFKKAVAFLQRPRVVPYQMRHSGASADRADGSRTAEETRGRGNWGSVRSMKRYEKVGRLATSARAHSRVMTEYFERCVVALPSVVISGAAPLAPPSADGARGVASRRG